MSESRDRVAEAYHRLGGNISAVSRELGIARSTVQYHVTKGQLDARPIAGGTVGGTEELAMALPDEGKVARYILTSAQNNTLVHEKVWANLLALGEHYDAHLLVGTFSYNRNAYGRLAVKRGSNVEKDDELWFDDKLTEYLTDARVALGKGLVWCGEMNIQPTSNDPLSGLETYSGRKSGIFPHVKHAMRSIAGMPSEGVKLNYTTGTVTQKNYIAKRAGLVAEHHHSYGAVIVEVDSDGHWWVRQLHADAKGDIYDLNLLASGGKVTKGHRVEAINWGDIHAATLDHEVTVCSLGKGGMLETLKPKYQLMHDVMEGVGTNHHGSQNPHDLFKAFKRGLHDVRLEGELTSRVLKAYSRPFSQMVVVASNHDGDWVGRWLREHDYRRDPTNALLFLELQLAAYKAIDRREPLNLVEALLRRTGCPEGVRFLATDETFKICGDRIECGMHGHLGPNGARGTPQALCKIGRRANTGHTHSAGIYDGLYVAGTSTSLDMGYNKGPSSWSHSHIVTYPNGQRTIVTMYNRKWRA